MSAPWDKLKVAEPETKGQTANGRAAKARTAEAVCPPVLSSGTLYGLAGEFVELTRPHTESSDSARLLTFLAAFGSAVGPGPWFRVEQTPHRARLFVAVAGATAKARKGTSLRPRR